MDGIEYAVKIFKTSILVFKDRDKYVSGEFRFRNGYCKSNPRKMVRTWAEKEMRNLKRLQSAGIPSPVPHLLKAHVLIMDFLGKDGWCACRLKDADLTVDQLHECYKTIVIDMRRMYHECNLVHGDLSEYNLLWHEERPVIIDVSQSVEHAHPFANDFLRKDVTNITDFFMRKGLQVLSKTELFNFVTDKYLFSSKNNDAVAPMEAMREKLDEVMAASESKREECVDEDREQLDTVDEAVFLQSYIPTSLNEIANPYKEMERMQKGGRETVFQNAIETMLGAGIRPVEEEEEEEDVSVAGDEDDDKADSDIEKELRALEGGLGATDGELTEGVSKSARKVSTPTAEEGEERDSDSEDGSDSDSEYGSSDEEGDGKYRRQLPTRDDPDARKREKDARREAKKLSKAAKATKRLTKIPKHQKKRSIKAGKK